MPFTLTMPKMSPTMEQGTIVKWHKAEGDFVAADDLLFEVSTDKATVEYNALDAGFLRKILIHENGEAAVNEAVAVFTVTADESIDGYAPEGIKPAAPAAPAAANAAAAAEAVPAAKAIKEKVGLAQPSFVPEAPLHEYRFQFPTEAVAGRIKASPLARRLAKEKGLDLSTVKGSGPGGRVMSRDLSLARPQAALVGGRRSQPSLPPGSYHEQALTPMRKVIAQRLQEAKSFIPHFYVSQRVDADPLLATRAQLKEVGLNVTVNDLVIKACALALRQHPIVNSGFNSDTQSIVLFDTVDIAVAVSLPEGLITPIIRHADYKNVTELGVEMKALAARAKEGKLQPHEYKGGSFTISNLGMFGVTQFQAIINPPQSAILAVSGIIQQPVVRDGNITVGNTMEITLSVDHRVIDGVAAAQFINSVKKYLENAAALCL